MMRSDRKKLIAAGRRIEKHFRRMIEIGKQRGTPMHYTRGELGFVLAGIDSLGAEAPPVDLVLAVARKLKIHTEAMLWARGVIRTDEVDGFSQIIFETMEELHDDTERKDDESDHDRPGGEDQRDRPRRYIDAKTNRIKRYDG